MFLKQSKNPKKNAKSACSEAVPGKWPELSPWKPEWLILDGWGLKGLLNPSAGNAPWNHGFGATAWLAACIDMVSVGIRSSTNRITRSFACWSILWVCSKHFPIYLNGTKAWALHTLTPNRTKIITVKNYPFGSHMTTWLYGESSHCVASETTVCP